MPILYGSKQTFNVILPLYIVASSLVVYAPDLRLKTLGYFLQGLLHLKITLAYTYIFELIPEKYKGICSSVINIIDVFTLIISGLTYQFITRDAVYFLEIVNLVETAFILLFLAIAPESPSWLLQN